MLLTGPVAWWLNDSRLVGVDGSSSLKLPKESISEENLLGTNLLPELVFEELVARPGNARGKDRGDERNVLPKRLFVLLFEEKAEGSGVNGDMGFLQGVSGGTTCSKPGFFLFRFESNPVLMNAVCKGFANLKFSGVEKPAMLLLGALRVLMSASKEVLSLNGCFLDSGAPIVEAEEHEEGVVLLFGVVMAAAVVVVGKFGVDGLRIGDAMEELFDKGW